MTFKGHPHGPGSRADEFRQEIRKVGELILLSRKIKVPRHAEESVSYRGSLKSTKAVAAFMSERKREREL
jgi:hypothetical protein